MKKVNEDNVNKCLKELESPFSINFDNQYYENLLKKLNTVIDLISEFHVDADVIRDAEEFRDRLMSLLEEYFKGHIHSAQASMISMINQFISAGEPFVSGIMECGAIPKGTDGKYSEVQWFKARLDAPEDGYTSEDMFHVPFTSREIVKTDRFSMPGIPCFYLGNTSYDCWLEMGKPAMNRFYVSPIKLKGQSLFLWDLTHDPTKI